MIVDAKPKALRLPTDAYYAVEEVHDVSVFIIHYKFTATKHLVVLVLSCVWLSIDSLGRSQSSQQDKKNKY